LKPKGMNPNSHLMKVGSPWFNPPTYMSLWLNHMPPCNLLLTYPYDLPTHIPTSSLPTPLFTPHHLLCDSICNCLLLCVLLHR
jgi:hypothetical protein